ncbi:hypothetical protein [Microbispora catharanthi]|uniref:Uncharacterized protein n=1 Tax=Microbispora catharanthi TaxID=1712871 RepID=A0A5N6BH95_9ACTN|nr:hypothetical protein [Microbispora catharanthi]KAB8179383.1 hypothetical protein FH610_035560 [Microbispora catharanthi]
MSLTMNRRRRAEVVIPQTWLSRMREQATKAGGRMSPVAETARDLATHRIEDARIWAAPKLDQAAQSVEEQIAPIVSAFLTELARRIDVSSARKTRRRWPVVALLGGVAIGAVGVAMYRNNAQRWTETMRESMRHTGSDASKWVGDKAGEVGEKADKAADEISGKMS